MNELALFAGAGGGLLGSKLLGHRTICYVETAPYCVAVIKARIHDGYLDDAPIWDDVRTFDCNPWRGVVDVITAGFPCQPFSVQGKKQGVDDARNEWPATIRIIREIRPHFALLENVPGLLYSSYWGTILGDLAEAGYDAEWEVLSACTFGAPQTRERLFVLAYTDSVDGQERLGVRSLISRKVPPRGLVAGKKNWRVSTRRIAGGNYGVAHRMDRLKALGNGQVPAVARAAWRLLS